MQRIVEAVDDPIPIYPPIPIVMIAPIISMVAAIVKPIKGFMIAFAYNIKILYQR